MEDSTTTMTTATFEGIEMRGGNPVAVFRWPWPITTYWFDYPGNVPTSRTEETFCLNEDSLLQRISNMTKNGRDCAQEKFALNQLRAKAEEAK